MWMRKTGSIRVCEPAIDSYVLRNLDDNPQLAKDSAGLRTYKCWLHLNKTIQLRRSVWEVIQFRQERSNVPNMVHSSRVYSSLPSKAGQWKCTCLKTWIESYTHPKSPTSVPKHSSLK